VKTGLVGYSNGNIMDINFVRESNDKIGHFVFNHSNSGPGFQDIVKKSIEMFRNPDKIIQISNVVQNQTI
jgi:hypothetical protein